MGYDTTFEGHFEFDRELTSEEVTVINSYNEPGGHLLHDLLMLHGGSEFLRKALRDHGSRLRCQWRVFLPGENNAERQVLAWDQAEKFSLYTHWLKHLVDQVIAPMGVKVNGEVEWRGEDEDDVGKLAVVDNVITVYRGTINIEWKKLGVF